MIRITPISANVSRLQNINGNAYSDIAHNNYMLICYIMLNAWEKTSSFKVFHIDLFHSNSNMLLHIG